MDKLFLLAALGGLIFGSIGISLINLSRLLALDVGNGGIRDCNWTRKRE